LFTRNEHQEAAAINSVVIEINHTNHSTINQIIPNSKQQQKNSAT